MYKLLNKLFGWDYVSWKNSADNGIARVYKSPDGVVYYWRYKVTSVADIITRKDQVIFLTCSADKYLGEQNAAN